MRLSKLKKTENLLYFNAKILLNLYPEENYNNVTKNIDRWEKNGEIIRLRRNLYITNDAYNRYKNNSEYLEFLACLIKYPSYLTAEYIMRKYDMLTEATYGYNLATTKTRSTITNKIGTFVYKKIKKELFTGYEVRSFLSGEYYVATKAKALFDYLYFRSRLIPDSLSKMNLVEDLRLNLEEMSNTDFDELLDYAITSKSKKMLKIVENIKKYR